MKKQAKQAARVNGPAFILSGAARPSAGTRLASHTAAVLSLTGMIDGETRIPAAELRQLIGETAFGYHARKGNFDRSAEGVKLSDEGVLHFIQRPSIVADPEMTAAYETILRTGKPDGNMVKNAEFIKPLAKAAK